MKHLKTLAAAAALALSASAHADLTNLSFEDGMDDWAGSQVSVESHFDGFTATDGNYFAKINGNGLVIKALQATSGILKFDFATVHAGAGAALGVGLYDSNDNLLSSQTFAPSEVAWNTFSWNIGANLDDELTIRLSNPGSGQNLLVDNLRIVPVPEPETYALMGLGVVALLLGRRKNLMA